MKMREEKMSIREKTCQKCGQAKFPFRYDVCPICGFHISSINFLKQHNIDAQSLKEKEFFC